MAAKVNHNLPSVMLLKRIENSLKLGLLLKYEE